MADDTKPSISWYKRITVYHYMIAFLAFLGVFYIFSSRRFELSYQLVLSPLIAALAETAIAKFNGKEIRFPDSAVIYGLFAALIMTSLYFALAATAAAVLLKNILRIKDKHIFNPAASGIVVVSLLAGLLGFTNTSPAEWWGATSFLVIPLGLFVAWKIRRLEVSVSLLAVYFSLTLLTTFLSGTAFSIYSIYDVGVFFFALFMAVEPRTSPANRNGKLVFGILLALLMFAGRFIPLQGITVDWFLVSLVIANALRMPLEKI